MEMEERINFLRLGRIVDTEEIEYRKSFDLPEFRKQIMNAFNIDEIEKFEKMSAVDFSLELISRNARTVMVVPDDIWQEIKEKGTAMFAIQLVAGQFE